MKSLNELFKNFNEKYKLSSNEMRIKLDNQEDGNLINKDFIIFVNGEKRVIISNKTYKSKTLKEIEVELEKIASLYNLDFTTLRNIYYKCSGNFIIIANFIEKNYILDKDMWSSIEDEIILSNNLGQIDILIKSKGLQEIMERKIFLNYFKSFIR